MAYQRSLEERKFKIIEDVCATCGGGGEDGGGDASPPDAEPTAGEDDVALAKALNKLKGKKKRKVVEGYKKPNSDKMMGQALKYEMDADKQSNKEKKMSFIDRARKIRNEMR